MKLTPKAISTLIVAVGAAFVLSLAAAPSAVFADRRPAEVTSPADDSVAVPMGRRKKKKKLACKAACTAEALLCKKKCGKSHKTPRGQHYCKESCSSKLVKCKDAC